VFFPVGFLNILAKMDNNKKERLKYGVHRNSSPKRKIW